MDWFLYDKDPRHERVKVNLWVLLFAKEIWVLIEEDWHLLRGASWDHALQMLF